MCQPTISFYYAYLGSTYYYHQVNINATHPWGNTATGWRYISSNSGDPAAGIFMNSPVYTVGLYDSGGSCIDTLILLSSGIAR